MTGSNGVHNELSVLSFSSIHPYRHRHHQDDDDGDGMDAVSNGSNLLELHQKT